MKGLSYHQVTIYQLLPFSSHLLRESPSGLLEKKGDASCKYSRMNCGIKDVCLSAGQLWGNDPSAQWEWQRNESSVNLSEQLIYGLAIVS